jgi:hypothetical protein
MTRPQAPQRPSLSVDSVTKKSWRAITIFPQPGQ